jgi:hypothetical protein
VPTLVLPEIPSAGDGGVGVNEPSSTPSFISVISLNSSSRNMEKQRGPNRTANLLFRFEMLLAVSGVVSRRFFRYVLRLDGAWWAQSSVALSYLVGSSLLAAFNCARIVSWSNKRFTHHEAIRGSDISRVIWNVHGGAEQAKYSRASSG